MDKGGEVLHFSSMTDVIPHYGLYGETDLNPALEPLHVETIEARSRAHGWKIQPHRHAELWQLMWVRTGGGTLRVEHETLGFAAPRLLAIPPGVVHGFEWSPKTDGYVLMASQAFMDGAPVEPGLLDAVINAPPAPTDDPTAAFEGLLAAFATGGPGRSSAMTGYAFVALSSFARAAAARLAAGPGRGPQGEIVQRYRALLEQDFRRQPLIGDFCERLGVTPTRLTRACLATTGATPLNMLHARLMLEARRLLTYTTLSAAEVGYGLGFTDPAYFSRFFRLREGASPAQWRAASGR